MFLALYSLLAFLSVAIKESLLNPELSKLLLWKLLIKSCLPVDIDPDTGIAYALLRPRTIRPASPTFELEIEELGIFTGKSTWL